ncbi:helix-turn-helix transcriptional regulator [Glaesserella parasuis]|uniref:helix-turn-helix transcriptional regulator n=1 Tax=Glaesserella parasuis TaxID=738 RepID=UPI001F25F08A|nr:AlpA family transcriptional regulator [Glaesserella parasuis]
MNFEKISKAENASNSEMYRLNCDDRSHNANQSLFFCLLVISVALKGTLLHIKALLCRHIMERAERFLKIDDVVARSGLAKTSIYRRIRSGQFPKSINLGGRRVVWLESELNEWMNAQIERNQREQQNAKQSRSI